MDHFKTKYDKDMVRVSLDLPNVSLKVFRKPKESSDWVQLDRLLPLPDAVLNIAARKVPENFTMPGLTLEKNPEKVTDMDTNSSGRISRRDSPVKK